MLAYSNKPPSLVSENRLGEVLRAVIRTRPVGRVQRGATTPLERLRTTPDVAPQLVPLSRASGDSVSLGRLLH